MTTRVDSEMAEKNMELISEFERYVFEHPEFAEEIPKGAVVSMQLDGDEEFNQWSQKLAEKQAEKGQPLVFVKITNMEPLRSRIKELELEQATR